MVLLLFVMTCSCLIRQENHYVSSNDVQVGGLEEAYLAAKPLLLSMGKRAIYCGGAGNGSASFVNPDSWLIIISVQMIPTHSWYWKFKAAKICNNMAMAISMLGVSEAFALGQNLGIKASTLTDIFNCSSARCWSRYCLLFSYNCNFSCKDYENYFLEHWKCGCNVLLGVVKCKS